MSGGSGDTVVSAGPTISRQVGCSKRNKFVSSSESPPQRLVGIVDVGCLADEAGDIVTTCSREPTWRRVVSPVPVLGSDASLYS